MHAGARIALRPEDVRHAALVLRLQPGDEVVVIAGSRAWRATIASIANQAATVEVVAQSDEGGELPQAVAVLQAVPKGNKMDYVIEKVVELGAQRIVPVLCARSYAGVSATKLVRWRNIARSAAQQSRRRIVPHVEEAITWNAALEQFATQSQLLVAHEGAAAGSLARALARESPALSLAVGPEGSFTQAELDSARETGADIVSLGQTILRTETAAVALLAAVAALKKWW